MNQIQHLSLRHFNDAWLAMCPTDRVTMRLARKTEANQQIREELFKSRGGMLDGFILGMMPDAYSQNDRLVDFCSGILLEIEMLNLRVRELESKPQ